MKGTKVIFAVCLVLLGFGNVWAMESDDAVRAATRRGETNTISATRKKSNTPDTSANANAASRVTNTTSKQTKALRERTTSPRANTNISTVSRASVTQANKQISTRNSGNVSSRAVQSSRATGTQNVSRATSSTRATVRAPSIQLNRSASTSHRASAARSAIAPNTVTQTLRDAVMNANAKECREIYYNCMDEFCANKDSQLKRCACSSRLNEFDSVKKQLATVEDKMLDFSQRLLTVSMDAEDAAALNIATEGELAFNKKDTSESKKILDEITNTLNTKFDDDSFGRDLTAISLSLNEDAAFDNVDSLMGASTTLKTGTALYSAALPVCREMAAEVCTQEQLSIAESGYQMMIEQDCNTVKKSYQSQTDSARAKILENSALLDMSRLSTYQDKNSDDILTCKHKMLDMLSSTSVCGNDMIKCLDMTGQYIDPSTGEAFLTTNLANLSKLLTRPTGNNTWTSMPGNETFVQYLDSKKMFLDPAMEHCQDISDIVWADFVEDALAQIKLAQNAKLEEVRQSCTTLTAQCLSETATSLEDFDSRALSTFGVLADKTVNEMCVDIKNACTALMETTGDDEAGWTSGMTEIATDTTYDTIIKTCREVGRACIIQACKSVSGNFGLCENIETSVNRKSIINGTSCWQEVLDCVADAGSTSIDSIMDQLASRNIIPLPKNTNNVSSYTPAYSFYSQLYDMTYQGTSYPVKSSSVENSGWDQDSCMNSSKDDSLRCVYDICTDKKECNGGSDTSTQCKTCRIAERIWGHCELSPTVNLANENSHNMIVKPKDEESTLLYWFALNTGTENISDSCRDTSCGPGERLYEGTCHSRSDFTDDGLLCKHNQFIIPDGKHNCCSDGTLDSWGNCCHSDSGKITEVKYSEDLGYYIDKNPNTGTSDKSICIPKNYAIQHILTVEPETNDGHYINEKSWLICMGTLDKNTNGTTNGNFPSGDTLTCDGYYLFITLDNGMYYYNESADSERIIRSYKINDGKTTCTLKYSSETGWKWEQDGTTGNDCAKTTPQDFNYKIEYREK